jgi:hypothetical protein
VEKAREAAPLRRGVADMVEGGAMSLRLVPRAVTVLALAVVFVLAAAASALAAPHDPSVSGTVLGSDGAPIPGATVVVNEQWKTGFRYVVTITADSAGRWSFTDKVGTYRFDFSAPDTDPSQSSLRMERDGSYGLPATLQAYGSLAGIVTNLGGAAVPAATVDIYARNGDGTWPSAPTRTVTTGSDGAFSSGTMPAGTYAVRASAEGYVTSFLGGATIDEATPVTVTRGTAATASLTLAPAPPPSVYGSISGVVVRTADRVPIGGAYVYFYKQNADGTWPPTSPGWGSPTKTVNTAADGTYASGDLPLGNYKVRFFDIHTGGQWWQYAASADAATVVPLTYGGQAVTGVEGWFGKP